jgi:hypothetical protein
MEKRFKVSQAAAQEIARKRGKNLRVFDGLDNRGI